MLAFGAPDHYIGIKPFAGQLSTLVRTMAGSGGSFDREIEGHSIKTSNEKEIC